MITTCLGFEENPIIINLAVHSLLARSSYHRQMDEKDFERLFVPPLRLEQFLLVWRDNKPVAFVTWAFPDEKDIEHYRLMNMFPSGAFYSDGQNPWIIDFICVSGREDVLFTCRELKRHLMYMGYERCFGLRTVTGRVGKHELKGD